MVMPLVKYFWKIRNTMMIGTEASAEPAISRPKSVEDYPDPPVMPEKLPKLVELLISRTPYRQPARGATAGWWS